MKKIISVQGFVNMIKTAKSLNEVYSKSPLCLAADRTQLQFTAAFMASPHWDGVKVAKWTDHSGIGLRSYCESRAADVPAYMKAQALKAWTPEAQ